MTTYKADLEKLRDKKAEDHYRYYKDQLALEESEYVKEKMLDWINTKMNTWKLGWAACQAVLLKDVERLENIAHEKVIHPVKELNVAEAEVQKLRAQLAELHIALVKCKTPDFVCSKSCACLDRTKEFVDQILTLTRLEVEPVAVVTGACYKKVNTGEYLFHERKSRYPDEFDGTLVVWPKGGE